MLTIVIPPSDGREYWDAVKREFIYSEAFEGATLHLEHSLYAISKWESKWKKPYISKEKRTPDEMLDYIRCMIVEEEMADKVLQYFTDENFKAINDYIEDPMTATKPKKHHGEKSGEIMTSEVIYCMMVMGQIPFECQHWHLNRLMMLIECVGIKNSPPKKMGKNDLMRRNSQLNAARKAKMHSKG